MASLGVRLVGRALRPGAARRIERWPEIPSRPDPLVRDYRFADAILTWLAREQVPVWEVQLPPADEVTLEDLRFLWSHRSWYIPEATARSLLWLAPDRVPAAVEAQHALQAKARMCNYTADVDMLPQMLAVVRTSPLAVTADGIFLFTAEWIGVDTPPEYPLALRVLRMARWTGSASGRWTAGPEMINYLKARYRAHLHVGWIPRTEPRASENSKYWAAIVPRDPVTGRYARVSPIGGLPTTDEARQRLLVFHTILGQLLPHLEGTSQLKLVYQRGQLVVLEAQRRSRILLPLQIEAEYGYTQPLGLYTGMAYVAMGLRGEDGSFGPKLHQLCAFLHEVAHLVIPEEAGRGHNPAFAHALLRVQAAARKIGVIVATDDAWNELLHARDYSDPVVTEDTLGNILTFAVGSMVQWPTTHIEPNALDLAPRRHLAVEEESESDEMDVVEPPTDRPTKRPRLDRCSFCPRLACVALDQRRACRQDQCCYRLVTTSDQGET